LGDELRCIGYVTNDDQEWLYRRDDLPFDTDADSSSTLTSRDGERESGFAGDAFHVVIFVTEADCVVFVGRVAETVYRCGAESVRHYGEVDTAVTAIVQSDGP
jgi:hypothetical protein